MARKKRFESFDPLLDAARGIPYRSDWNRLTGSPLASILLQQIVFRWQVEGRKPFYKYQAPCPSARVGDSWLEELGFSLRQFRRARASIATKTRRHLKDEALKTNIVVYWTESNHRTYYAINEALLLTRLADALVSTGKVPPDAHHELWPIAAHSGQQAEGQNVQLPTAQNGRLPLDEAANSCTEKTRDEQQRHAGVGETELDEELVETLARLGDSNPREVVACFPNEEIRHWIDYVHSPQGKNLRNIPGFIRSKLKQSEERRQMLQTSRAVQSSTAAGTEAERIWSACLEELASQVSPEAFSAWLERTRGLTLRHGTLRVAVGNRFARDTLDHTLRRTIEGALAQVAENLAVEFVEVLL